MAEDYNVIRAKVMNNVILVIVALTWRCARTEDHRRKDEDETCHTKQIDDFGKGRGKSHDCCRA